MPTVDPSAPWASASTVAPTPVPSAPGPDTAAIDRQMGSLTSGSAPTLAASWAANPAKVPPPKPAVSTIVSSWLASAAKNPAHVTPSVVDPAAPWATAPTKPPAVAKVPARPNIGGSSAVNIFGPASVATPAQEEMGQDAHGNTVYPDAVYGGSMEAKAPAMNTLLKGMAVTAPLALVPGAGAAVGAEGLGALVPEAAGPVAQLVAKLIGGVGGGALAEAGQHGVFRAVAPGLSSDLDADTAALHEQSPVLSAILQGAGMRASFKPGEATLGSIPGRVIGGGAMAGIGAAQRYMQGGKTTPADVAADLATGAYFGGEPTDAVRSAVHPVESVAARWNGRSVEPLPAAGETPSQPFHPEAWNPAPWEESAVPMTGAAKPAVAVHLAPVEPPPVAAVPPVAAPVEVAPQPPAVSAHPATPVENAPESGQVVQNPIPVGQTSATSGPAAEAVTASAEAPSSTVNPQDATAFVGGLEQHGFLGADDAPHVAALTEALRQTAGISPQEYYGRFGVTSGSAEDGNVPESESGDTGTLFQRKSTAGQADVPVLYGSPDVKSLRAEKNTVSAGGFDPAEVRTMVDRNYNPDAYRAALEGKDNVYLPIPSTSGRNIIPDALAERLQRDFGGEIVQRVARPLAATEAKHKLSFSAKIAEPSSYEIKSPVSQYAGKNVVIVDDAYNTGESVDAFRRALASAGLDSKQTAVLAASDVAQTTSRDMERLSGKIEGNLNASDSPVDPAMVRDAVEQHFTGTAKQYFNYAERSIQGSPAAQQRAARSLYDALLLRSGRDSDLRTHGEGTGGLQRGTRAAGEAGQANVSGQGTVSQVSGLAGRQVGNSGGNTLPGNEGGNSKQPDSLNQAHGADAPRASVQFFDPAATTRIVLRALASPDVTSAIHEIGHVTRRDLWRLVADRGEVNGITADHLKAVEDWAGVKDGDWSGNTHAEEKFAQAFERYVMDGKAPTPRLQPVFDYLRTAMHNIYGAFRGQEGHPAGVDISPAVRDVFDRMMGGGKGDDTPSPGRDAPVDGSRYAGSTNVDRLDIAEPIKRAMIASSDPGFDDGSGRTHQQIWDAGTALNVGPDELRKLRPGQMRPGVTDRGAWWAATRQLVAHYAGRVHDLAGQIDSAQTPADRESLLREQIAEQSNLDMAKQHNDKAAHEAGSTLSFGNFLVKLKRNFMPAAGVRADDVVEPKPAEVAPKPTKTNRGKPTKYVQIAPADKAEAISAIRSHLLNQGAVPKPEPGPDILHQSTIPPTPFHEAISNIGSEKIEQGFRTREAFQGAITEEIGKDAAAEIKPGDWETAYQNSRAKLAAAVKAHGGTDLTSQHVGDALAKTLTREGAASFFNRLSAMPGDVASRYVTGGMNALSSSERDAVGHAYNEELGAAGKLGTARARGSAISDLANHASAMRKADERAAKVIPTPKPKPHPFDADITATYKSRKSAAAFFDTLGPDLAARLRDGAQESDLSDHDKKVIVDAHDAADTVRKSARGVLPTRPKTEGAITVHDVVKAAQQDAQAARKASANVAGPAPTVRIPTAAEMFDRRLANSYGGKDTATQWKADVGADIYGKLLLGRKLTDEESAEVQAAHDTAIATKEGHAEPGTPNPAADANKTLSDILAMGRKAKAAQDRADTEAARSQSDRFANQAGVKARYGVRGADGKITMQPFRDAIGEDLFGKVARGESLTRDELAAVGDAAITHTKANAARPAQDADLAAANKTLSEARRQGLRAIERQRIASLSPREHVREQLLNMMPDVPKDATPEYAAKVQAVRDKESADIAHELADIAPGDKRELANLVSRRAATLQSNLTAYVKSGYLSGTHTYEKIGLSHTLGGLAEEANRPVASVADHVFSSYLGSGERTRPGADVASAVHAVRVGGARGAREGGQIIRYGPGGALLGDIQHFEGTGGYDDDTRLGHIPGEFHVNGKLGGVLNPILRANMRIHGAAYHIGSSIGMDRALSELYQVRAINEANTQGLKGAERNTFVKQYVAENVAEARRGNAPEADLAHATARAQEWMFQNPNAVNTAVQQGIKSIENTHGKGSANFARGLKDFILAPFLKVPLNVAARRAEYITGSVVAPARAIIAKNYRGLDPANYRADSIHQTALEKMQGRDDDGASLRAFQGNISDQFARGATGLGLAGLGYALSKTLAVNAPNAKNHERGSLRIGTKELPLAGIDPAMAPLLIGAAIAEHPQHPIDTIRAFAPLWADAPGVRSSPFVEFLQGVAHADPSDPAGKKLLKGAEGAIASLFQPNGILNELGSTFDPRHIKRAPSGVWEAIEDRTPFARNHLAPLLVGRAGQKHTIEDDGGALQFLQPVPRK